ncbi:zinc finger protein 729-like isoform X2 [Ochlerotatus camptorhynchus]|uniref:zinc finger protein 729-like isoform X2 n=1 Tax=Ochlerotatus camptorhynchus TaxID=644619 RepID=UPI0031DD7652
MSKPSCLEGHQGGELELHREICVVRLMFRCDICYDDYVSKEGIWNHLDLHEIADESKELHYQEIKAKDKLYQCALCNDQRAYLESLYWKHVQDVHDGFFLRCPECGESFRSEKLKHDHAISHCKTRDQTVTSNWSDLEADRITFKRRNHQDNDEEHQKRAQTNDIKMERKVKESTLLSHEGKSSINPSTKVDPQSSEQSFADLDCNDATDSHIINKECKVIPVATLNNNSEVQVRSENISQTFAEHPPNQPYLCDICGSTLTSYSQAKYHKLKKHTDGKLQCPHCFRMFHLKNKFKLHKLACAGRKNACELCGRKFKNPIGVKRHKLRSHHGKRPLKNDNNEGNEEQNQNSAVKMDSDESSANCSVDNSASTPVKSSVVHDSLKAVPQILQPQDNPSSGLSNIKCSYCTKEFANGLFLRRHIEHCHVPCVCNICDITFESFVKAQYHKIKLHKEPKHRCPHCPKTFEKSIRYSLHLAICKEREFSCDLCNQKFKTLKYVKKHKRLYHQDKNAVKKVSKKTTKKASKKASEKAVNKTKNCRTNGSEKRKRKQPKRGAVEKSQNSKLAVITDCPICGKTFSSQHVVSRHVKATHQMTICIICRTTFSSADELMDHKRTCPKNPPELSDSQFGTRRMSPLGDNIEIKMEIQVEDTMLQEQEYQVPKDDQGKSSITTLTKDPGGKSKDIASEDVYLGNGIKIKQECPEEEEDTFIESQSTTECSVCRGDSSDRNEPPLRHEADDQFSPCSSCGHIFATRKRMKYHMVVIPTEP